ncbi:MAG TPA: HlyD family secretion protein, partial [Sphingobacteriaceae bacterium]|nr:HlyD family secretion protein [Sphingobacteriaceae bacterium]
MKYVYVIALAILASACNRNKNDADASGTFEADEVIVSSEIGGKLLSFTPEEGTTLDSGKTVGVIDAENISLQKQ